MKPKIHAITLGVQDVAKSRKFYEESFGWKASSVSNDSFVAFQIDGMVLSLYSDELLAEDAQTKMERTRTFRGITLAHNVATKNEVDTILQHAVDSGARLEKKAQDVFWGGYSGYFSDPDGHFWEIAWNPHWTLLSNGALCIPE